MSPEDLAPFAESLAMDARWLFPEAPVPASLVPGEIQGRSWWQIDPIARLEALERGPRDFAGFEPPDLPAARALLGRVLDEALELAGGRPLVLAGFSSGGMLAFDLQVREARPIVGLALLSATRIAWSEQSHFATTGALARLPVFLSHGTADEDLAFAAGTALRDAASNAGAEVTWVPFEGGHYIPVLAWSRLRRWLRTLIGRSSPA